MIEITKHNYEAFVPDFLEGNLSEEIEAAFFKFLESNPEVIIPELEEDLDFDLKKEKTIYPSKESLKKSSNELNRLELLMIGEIEGINSRKETLDLNHELSQSKTLEASFNLFKKSILKQENISYAHKGKLKKENKVIFPLYWKVAASVLLFISLYFILRSPNDPKINPKIVEFNKTPKVELPTPTPPPTVESHLMVVGMEQKQKTLNKSKKDKIMVALKPKESQTINIKNSPASPFENAEFKKNISTFTPSATLAKAEIKNTTDNSNEVPVYEVKLKTLSEVLEKEIAEKILDKKSTANYNTYAFKLGKFEIYSKRKK